jgi:hypothetical protein
MKTIFKYVGLAAAALSLTVASGVATAARGGHFHGHGGGFRGGVHFGVTVGSPFWYPGPFYGPFLYPVPAFAYAPPVVIQSTPQTYIQRDDMAAQPAPSPSPYWYYCRDSNTYYPYVRECASQWEQVPASPMATQ